MPSLSISLKHLIKGMNRLPYLSMWTHDMNSASALLGEVSVWSLLVHIKGHPAKVMMNAEGGRAADFSGIGSAGHGGWWVNCLRWGIESRNQTTNSVEPTQ